MLLIYTHQVTSRVKYTFGLIFNSILGIQYRITTNPDEFRKFEGAKISYLEKALADEIQFECGQLLFETGLNPSCLTLPFMEKGVAPKDIFALAFFLAARYEEYLPFAADEHGRFSANQSYANKNNFLHKPIVNIWAEEIQNKISARYPGLIFPKKKYSYTPTIDIDNAYAYRGKNTTRTLGGYVKAILKGNGDDFAKRKNVLEGKEKDPFDTYELQSDLHKEFDLKPIYFFLLADWAPNDKNLPYDSPLMRSLIKDIAEKADVGIHPSYESNKNPEKVKVEEKRLRETTGRQTTKSRQHFLKLRFPDTYRNLIAAGITDDYSLGYADALGFRASICTPFKWYDLAKEEETNLTIHPFAVMDGTLNGYLKLSPEQAVDRVKEVINEVKGVNGECITIWHNETLSDWREWKGWKNVYEKVIKLAVLG